MINPLVSIVVPSFNQGRFIRATLDSILEQDYRPLQIHVIDGGSKDETVEVLKSYGDIPELRWVSERDSGVVEAVNKGFAQAKGEFVGIQSSDDTYLPGAISQAMATFREHPQCGLVYGDTIKIDAEGIEVSKYRIGPFSRENFFLFRTWIPQPSAFFRRALLEQTGVWDNSVPYAADTDLWLRMMFKTEVMKVDAYWSQRRIHDAQRDTQAAKIARDYCKMIDQSADIAAAPASLQQMAEASKHLIRVRYNATGSDWYAAWHTWRAGQYASSCKDLRQVAFLLALPTRRVLSRLKRSLQSSPIAPRK